MKKRIFSNLAILMLASFLVTSCGSDRATVTTANSDKTVDETSDLTDEVGSSVEGATQTITDSETTNVSDETTTMSPLSDASLNNTTIDDSSAVTTDSTDSSDEITTTTTQTTTTTTTITPQTTTEAEKTSATQAAALYNATYEAVSSMGLSKMLLSTDAGKVAAIKLVYEWIVRYVTYDIEGYELYQTYISQGYSDEDAANLSFDLSVFEAYGAIVNHEAVCEGYAKAFDYMLDIIYEIYNVEIKCRTIYGYMYDTSTSGSEYHCWNAVYIGSSWYYIDVTAGDPVISKNGSVTVTAYGSIDNILYNTFLLPYDYWRLSYQTEKSGSSDTSYRIYSIDKDGNAIVMGSSSDAPNRTNSNSYTYVNYVSPLCKVDELTQTVFDTYVSPYISTGSSKIRLLMPSSIYNWSTIQSLLSQYAAIQSATKVNYGTSYVIITVTLS